jgi:hypothetical protein
MSNFSSDLTATYDDTPECKCQCIRTRFIDNVRRVKNVHVARTMIATAIEYVRDRHLPIGGLQIALDITYLLLLEDKFFRTNRCQHTIISILDRARKRVEDVMKTDQFIDQCLRDVKKHHPRTLQALQELIQNVADDKLREVKQKNDEAIEEKQEPQAEEVYPTRPVDLRLLRDVTRKREVGHTLTEAVAAQAREECIRKRIQEKFEAEIRVLPVRREVQQLQERMAQIRKKIGEVKNGRTKKKYREMLTSLQREFNRKNDEKVTLERNITDLEKNLKE